MKSLWVATGVVVGLGVAGLVAANTGGDNESPRIIGGADTAVDSVPETTSPATTTTDADEQVDSATTSTVDEQAQNAVPTTHSNASTPTPPATAAPTNPPTTAVYSNAGDECTTVGAHSSELLGGDLVCVAGTPNRWQHV